jgi:hypothetical protein
MRTIKESRTKLLLLGKMSNLSDLIELEDDAQVLEELERQYSELNEELSGLNEQREIEDTGVTGDTEDTGEMEEISKEYAQMCTLLGDIQVRQQGLENQRRSIMVKLEALDIRAQGVKK